MAGNINKTPLYLFLVAVVLRILRLACHVSSPYFAAPFLDTLYNYEWALRLAHGDWVSGNEVFFRAPLYPYFLGVIFFAVGPDFFIPLAIQHILGALGAVGNYFLFRKMFSERAGIVAGLLFAIYPAFIFFEGELLDIWIQVSIYPWILLSALRLKEEPGAGRGLVFGALCGLSAVGRPTIVVILPFLFACLLGEAIRQHQTRRMVASFLAAVAGFFILVAPVTLRNWVVAKDPVMIATYGGINFYIGNGPNADGFTASTPKRFYFSGAGPYRDSVDSFAIEEASLRMGHPVKASEASSYWFDEGLRAIADDPARWVGLMAKKSTLFWSGLELRNNQDLEFALQFDPILRPPYFVLNFRVLAPLALLGLGIAWTRRRSFALLLVTVFVALYFGSLILFFINTRYRLPIIPLLLGFSAYTIVTVAEQMRAADKRALLCELIGLAAAAVFVNVNWWKVPAHQPSLDYWTVGNAYREKGQYDKAEDAYEKSLSYDESNWEAWETLGENFFAQREIAKAVGAFKTALSIYPNDLRARNNLGVCYEESGKLEEARREYLAVVEQEPRHELAWVNLGDTELKMGNADAATMAYDKALEINSSNLLAHWGALRAALQKNDRAKAVEHYEFLIQNATGELQSAVASLRPKIFSLPESHDSRSQDKPTTSAERLKQ
ncbi:MAG: tetratricopeptide repeat protein [bacterium]